MDHLVRHSQLGACPLNTVTLELNCQSTVLNLKCALNLKLRMQDTNLEDMSSGGDGRCTELIFFFT